MADPTDYKALLYDEYYIGLLVFIFISLVGLAMIVKAMRKDTTYFNGLIRMPLFIQIAVGAIPQLLFIGYLWLGYRAGAF